ncbi:uncharacterized protein PHACADRAFT_185387 [Phanerochaete carnosa HHB-10118-sp]|uniref:Uncharacterized protein n=1 Tax=Phanerochaete carnosa (strain HHB-10118-sp) TaxID=650164 RepID=K5UWN9_PHACS|nr:uncharacterized protein PHACADRAFT_185387 [Phanerochaete carnosa HHB-10118-sp]EKM54466.1 hypothetical protein PHACADRAFT_185387 [Phanerochaete carnosa HHB-10118-sp]
MFPVLDLIRTREINRLRGHPSPTVAWHALDNDTISFPFYVVFLMVLFVLIVQFGRHALFVPPFPSIPTWISKRLSVRQQPGTKTHPLHTTPNIPPAIPSALKSLTFTLTLPSAPSIPAWIADWFKDPLTNRTHVTRFTQLNDRYRVSVEKFVKISHRYKSLQAQLKERDERLHRQGSALHATTAQLEGFQTQVEQLREDSRRLCAANERLHAEQALLEQRTLDQFYEHARQLHEREREQEALERVIDLLEQDKAASQGTLQEMSASNEALMDRVAELEHELTHQHETSFHAESALEEAVKCNESLLQELHDTQVIQGRREDVVSEQLAAVEADCRTALENACKENDALRKQLAHQQAQHARERDQWGARLEALEEKHHAAMEEARKENLALRDEMAKREQEHLAQHELLTEKLALAKADKRDAKAKLRRVREEVRLKASDIARLESRAAQYEHLYEQQCDSFQQDLHFVHVETSYQRNMYEDKLGSVQAESAALHKQLADCVKRYEEQSARLRAAQVGLRDASHMHHQLELKLKAAAAEKEVAADLENLLSDALKREQDKFETLEISFDVLEGAYSFLARELVRTEHALEDALQIQQQLRERVAPLYDEPESVYPGEDLPEQEHSSQEYTSRAYVSGQRAESESPMLGSIYSDGDASSWPATPGLVRSARNSTTPCSMYSDGDASPWPATPGLTRSMHSTGTSITSVSSPVVTTPPLPPLMLEPLPSSDSGLAKHLPPADSDDFFGPIWTVDAMHHISQ